MKTKTQDTGTEFITHWAAIFLAAWIIMLLWGALVPVIFGLPTVGYWQALGLRLLVSCLTHEIKTNKE